MAVEVKLPRLGQGMESGTIVKWLKAEGEAVKKGEPLYELDTDKVTQEVEAEADGVLLAIEVQEGEVLVGRTIAVIGKPGETYEVAAPAAPVAAVAPVVAAPVEAVAPVAPAANGGRIKASPLARRIARERGIELRGLAGTGPEGRIVAEDVERAARGHGSRRGSGGAGRGRRARAAYLAAQDDRPPDDRGVARARVPDHDVRGHEPRPRAARAARRAPRRGREADDLRRAHQGLRRRVDASSRGQCALRRRRDRAPSDRQRRHRRRARRAVSSCR